MVRKPVLIRRVEDSDGKVLFNEPGKADRAVSESTAFLMASMLADVINAGTAYRARQSGFTLPAAGKTGTTNDYDDAWFVGFTPKLVTGVWIGFDQPKTIIRNGYAGEIAVPLWAGFMKVATTGDKPEWLARPAVGDRHANVCRISGKLPAGGCDHVEVVNRDGALETRSMIYTEYFVKGTQPTDLCPLHEDRGRSSTRLPACSARTPGPPPLPVGRHRPAGAAAPASTDGQPRRSPAPPRRPRAAPRRRRPRRSAASGRASSAAATRTSRTRRKRTQEEGRAEEKVRRVIRFSRPTCPFEISPGTAVSSICGARGCPRFAAAQPHLRGTRRHREAARRASRWRSCSTARARSPTPPAISRPTPAAHCTRLPAHRPRRARRRPGDRAGRHRLDQGRSGARGDRAQRATGRSKGAVAS